MSDAEGLRIARRLIEEEAEKKTGGLNLSELGLTELPAEIACLGHLRRLYIGRWYPNEAGKYWWTANSIGPNSNLQTWTIPEALTQLEYLSLNETDCTDLNWLANLQSLNVLDCQFTLVSDLSPLANLQSLNSLDCSGTQVIAPKNCCCGWRS